MEITVATDTLVRAALVAVGTVAAVWVLVRIHEVLVLLVLSLVLAIALDPAVRSLQRHGSSRGLAVAAVMAVVFSTLVGVAWLLAKPFTEQAVELVEQFPVYVQEAVRSEAFRELDQGIDLSSGIERAETRLTDSLAGWIGGGIGWVVRAATSLVFLAVFTVLALVRGPDLVRATLVTFPRLAERRAWTVLAATYHNISRYFAGTIVVALIGGVVSFSAMLALDVPQPLPLALWITILALIPIIGAFVGAIPALVVATADDWWKGLVLALLMLAYQQTEQAVISPNILGRAVRVSPLFIIVAVLAGYQLLGIVGIVLAVPCAGTLEILLREYRRTKARQEPELVERAKRRADSVDHA